MIISNIKRLRDPFMLVDNGVYYLYGSGWVCYKNTDGKLSGNWQKVEGPICNVPAEAIDNYWAPEVHKYKGDYYMFTTYFSSVTKRRGCTILKSNSPEGPFTEITDGHITPKDWDAIDGTFYVDEEGRPWMIFVHEWVSTDDNIGRMAAAELSCDLTHFVSEPLELFRADDPSWTNNKVTDGCFMYKTGDGQLLMLWSNFDRDGAYCVGIARSEEGLVTGEWKHDEKLLFSKETTGKYDGGHGMIFTDLDGKMYLSVHSPNYSDENVSETPVFVRVREENGNLLCDEA